MKKKLITFLGIMSIGTFSWHSILTVQYFLGLMPHNIGMTISGFAFVFFLTMHMVLTLIDIIKTTKRTSNEKFYINYSFEQALQNMSGLFIFGFAVLHAVFIELHKAFGTQIFSICWWLTDILLFLCISIHLCITLPHVMISCGIVTNRKLYNFIKIIIYIVSVSLFVLLTYAHTVFTFA